jgi:hypothetical protein
MLNHTKSDIQEFIMPLPICPKCGTALNLDKTTYENYEGQITCYDCKSRMTVVIRSGALRECYAAVDPDLWPPEEYPYVRELPQYWVAYLEALKCLQADAHKACAVMCRLALEHALVERGATVGARVQSMVSWAKGRGIIAGRYKSLVDSVTFLGGVAGHAQDDEILDVGPSEAIQGARVTRDLLVMLFPVSEARVSRPPMPAPDDDGQLKRP